MSSTEEEKHLPEDVFEINEEARKGPKISYTRDFLMSFMDSDACKKFPSGFDQANEHLGDLIQDRQRPSGGLPLNSLRRNEYGSSPPTRGDSSGYSRGIQGRWDTRSSGRSDRDSDTQSEWDPDSSRRYGNQPRRSWQVPEHDGLLGSGSFPRPSGFAAGPSAPKGRPNEQYQLNRSTEPYQPPRPYKAAPHSRRDTDAFNNETFGSSECTDEERAEEERKRRASFESMRKEQHKTFQPEKRVDFDISTLLDESKNENRSLKRGSEAEDLAVPTTTKDSDAEKSSAPSHTPAARPLVPPGFNSTAVDRSTVAKSLAHSHTEEAEKSESGDSHLFLGKRNYHAPPDDQEEKRLARDIGFRKQQSTSSHASINDQRASKNNEVVELNVEKVISSSILGDSNQDRSTSILSKLFTNSLALNDTGSSAAVHHETQAEEPQDIQSSKFACWFKEEDKKPCNNHVSGEPNELLSLIAGEKGGTRVSGNKSQKSSPSLAFPNSGSGEMLAMKSTKVGSFDKLNEENKREPLSGVFTCEDLEQSMLSAVSVDVPISQSPVQSWTNPNGKSKQPKSSTDNLASQHLLSLLQKRPTLKETGKSSNIGSSYAGNVSVFEEPSIGVVQNTREAEVKSTTDSANNLTLETLFGSAFMKELQSVGAPVSSQRPLGSSQPDVSEPRGFPFPAANNNHESEFSSGVLNGGAIRKQTSMDSRIEEPWLKFDNLQAGLNSSQLRTNYGTKIVGFNAPTDVGFPEEDSLIAASNTPGGDMKTDYPPSSNAQMDFAEKLGAFNTGYKDERSMRGAQEIPFRRGPFEMREPGHSYQNPTISPPFAQLHNNMGTQLPHMDSRAAIMNSQMKFMSPKGVPNQQMPMNMLRPPFRHPSAAFDQLIPHAMLQQMQMQQGNFPPNMIHGPSPPNRMSAHPNFPGLGMSPPAHDVGGGSGHHPEALQRLIEMELRSNPKQIRPMTSGGQSQRMYGHELDMGFGFR